MKAAAEFVDLEGLHAEIKGLRRNVELLLKHVGTVDVCRGCGAEIVWVRHIDTLKYAPYNADGTSHFSNCRKAEQFRKGKADGR